MEAAHSPAKAALCYCQRGRYLTPMKVDRTNAQRQARFRAKQRQRLDEIEARIARLEAEVARLRAAPIKRKAKRRMSKAG